MIEELEDKFSKYEVARILGARALQISMDAPLLLKIPEAELEEMNFNPLEIARKELIAEVLPITINRPLPQKKEQKLKMLTKKEVEEKIKKAEDAKIAAELEAEKEIEAVKNAEPPKDSAQIKSDEVLEEKAEEDIVEEGAEIMELATPEDEKEDTGEDKPVEI